LRPQRPAYEPPPQEFDLGSQASVAPAQSVPHPTAPGSQAHDSSTAGRRLFRPADEARGTAVAPPQHLPRGVTSPASLVGPSGREAPVGPPPPTGVQREAMARPITGRPQAGPHAEKSRSAPPPPGVGGQLVPAPPRPLAPAPAPTGPPAPAGGSVTAGPQVGEALGGGGPPLAPPTPTATATATAPGQVPVPVPVPVVAQSGQPRRESLGAGGGRQQATELPSPQPTQRRGGQGHRTVVSDVSLPQELVPGEGQEEGYGLRFADPGREASEGRPPQPQPFGWAYPAGGADEEEEEEEHQRMEPLVDMYGDEPSYPPQPGSGSSAPQGYKRKDFTHGHPQAPVTVDYPLPPGSSGFAYAPSNPPREAWGDVQGGGAGAYEYQPGAYDGYAAEDGAYYAEYDAQGEEPYYETPAPAPASWPAPHPYPGYRQPPYQPQQQHYPPPSAEAFYPETPAEYAPEAPLPRGLAYAPAPAPAPAPMHYTRAPQAPVRQPQVAPLAQRPRPPYATDARAYHGPPQAGYGAGEGGFGVEPEGGSSANPPARRVTYTRGGMAPHPQAYAPAPPQLDGYGSFEVEPEPAYDAEGPSHGQQAWLDDAGPGYPPAPHLRPPPSHGAWAGEAHPGGYAPAPAPAPAAPSGPYRRRTHPSVEVDRSYRPDQTIDPRGWRPYGPGPVSAPAGPDNDVSPSRANARRGSAHSQSHVDPSRRASKGGGGGGGGVAVEGKGGRRPSGIAGKRGGAPVGGRVQDPAVSSSGSGSEADSHSHTAEGSPFKVTDPPRGADSLAPTPVRRRRRGQGAEDGEGGGPGWVVRMRGHDVRAHGRWHISMRDGDLEARDVGTPGSSADRDDHASGSLHWDPDEAGLRASHETLAVPDPGAETVEGLRSELATIETLIMFMVDGITLSPALPALTMGAGGAAEEKGEVRLRIAEGGGLAI
jgi:hypothetical protein